MIVLLTDFGESEYVGVMKGVILGIDAKANIVDLTHSVSPQSVREAAWILLKSYKYFPQQSLFVCIVDPGVGTERDAVLIETAEHAFIGPDNGLFSPIVQEESTRQIYSIIPRSAVSRTFHGRDVFAVAAGQYHSGTPARNIGFPKDALDVPLSFHLKGRTGEVVRIDRFGNIVTNIPPGNSKSLKVTCSSTQLRLPVVKTYAEGPATGLFLLVGSYGTLEIASQGRKAINHLSVTIGETISIE